MKRNSYIDGIKFLFAIVIVLFHFGNEICPGGRVAVEGFFMISGFLMRVSISRMREKDALGKETWCFIKHKYTTLFPILLPSVFIAIIVSAISKHTAVAEVIHKLPLIIFELLLVKDFGFNGWYVLGISWYLSSMMFALAILFPLCRKWGNRFTMSFGIPICALFYGILSYQYGNIAINGFLKDTIIPVGLIRGFVGCLAGCIMYDFVCIIQETKVKPFGRCLLIICTGGGYAYLWYAMKNVYKSSYDYVLVVIIFFTLLIGISGISGIWKYYSGKWTVILGKMSTLMVLNHYYWNTALKILLGNDYGTKNQWGVWIYISCVICTSLIVWLLENVNHWFFRKIKKMCVSEKTS